MTHRPLHKDEVSRVTSSKDLTQDKSSTSCAPKEKSSSQSLSTSDHDVAQTDSRKPTNTIRNIIPSVDKSTGFLIVGVLTFLVLCFTFLTIGSMDYLYWRPEKMDLSKKATILLKVPHDHLFYTSLTAFKPLLAQLVPAFHSHLLQNQKFVESLKKNENETQLFQDMIDSTIYGGPEVPCTDMNVALKVLFMLNRAEGDFIALKTKCLNFVKDQIRFENILDVLDLLNVLIQRDEEIHSKNSTSLNRVTILHNLKEYCLDFLGTNSNQRGYETFVENDIRMIQYFKPAFKRKQIRMLKIDETQNYVVSHPSFAMFKSGYGSDLQFRLSNGKIIPAHKTILLNSNSTVLHRLVLENAHSKEIKEDEEMEYLLQYCYGFLRKVPSRMLIPTIKKAYQYGMKELIHILQKELVITVHNFFEYSHALSQVMEEPALRRQFAEFGVQHGASLFPLENNYKHLHTLRSELKDEIIITFASRPQ
ncbi:hypothetical protein C9374_005574 [Naegleria lovaniensis]|uniref:BTB domain-containing protein n=1 Tax=Naegleria lovaniensis TaxID=51637 RepID=A0AA88GQ74_NAELO|nr:uncharacterized protein C9374_005574 [Naegleria lovaniensis]KAG2382372.1 hypothetical protein C9374_005574 [Naegleria lovaniensis]